MSEPAFTPGPWHFLEAHNHDDEWSKDHPLTICDEKNSEDLANVFSADDSTVSVSRKEAIANAFLIASSPDLYAVAKAADEFVSAILEKRGEMNDAAYPAGLQALPLLKQIRAALGKVEGEGK
jgi:hypothetical protein